jgi:hypothetical protein
MHCLQLSYISRNIFTVILFYFSLLVKFRHACQYREWVMRLYVCIYVSLYGIEDVIRGKVKVMCTLVQSLRLCTGRTAHRGSRGIALLFLDHGTRRG